MFQANFASGKAGIANIQKKNIMDSMNLGLENLKERVKLISGKDCEVIDDGNRFTVRLPIIPITHEGPDN